MKKIIALFVIVLAFQVTAQELGEGDLDLTNSEVAPAAPAPRHTVPRAPAQNRDVELARALELARAGKYEDASIRLFRLSLNPQYQPFHMQIKYILGLMLMEMKLNQAAAFQFVDVVKEGNSRYVRDAIAKLALAANALDDDTLVKIMRWLQPGALIAVAK